MSQATLPSRLDETAPVPEPISSRLRALRRAVGLWLWAKGLAYLLLLLAAVVGIDLLIDRVFRMDRVQRGGCLLLASALLAYCAYRWLIRPLRQEIDDDSLCLQVEKHHTTLRQSLISALQFSRMTGFEEIGVSTSMVRATIQHGTTAAGEVDFGAVMNESALRRNLLLAFAVVAMFAGAFAAEPTRPTMLTWLSRNVLLSNERWPQKSYLVVQGALDGRLVVPRGDDMHLVVTVQEDREEMPTEVYLESRPLGVPFWRASRTDSMDQEGDEFKLTFSNVLDPFRFRLTSNHETTRWYTVDLVDRPRVEELNLMLTPPLYTGEQPRQLEMGKGPYVAYGGSRLAIFGTANKTLSAAVLSNGDLSIELDCADETFRGEISVGQLRDGVYSIMLTDNEQPQGLKSSSPLKFSIKLKTDRPPTVRATLKGVSGIILAQAVVPVDCKIRDEFAIASARLDYEVKAADVPSAPTADGPEPEVAANVVSLPFDDLGDQFGKKKIEFLHPFEVSLLKLEVDMRLEFRVKATDTNNVSGPGVGESGKLSLRIVTRSELQEDLLRREREQGQEFERLLKDQIDMLTDTRAILAAVGEKSTMPDAQRKLLIRVKRRENVVDDRCEQIASQLEKLVAEMRNNRLDEKAKEDMLNKNVIGPLRYLASVLAPEATRLLDEARRSASIPASRDEALAKAVATQEQIVLRMQKIVTNMITAEGYSDVVIKLREIIRLQNQVNEETRKAKEAELDRLFRGDADGLAPKKTDGPAKKAAP